MVDKVLQMSLLFDFYGQLLTEKQQEILNLYHGHDWSLGEISENQKISRQAVHDHIKRAEKTLFEYETKLKLVQKFVSTQNRAKEILKIFKEFEEIFLKSYSEDTALLEKLNKIKQYMDELL